MKDKLVTVTYTPQGRGSVPMLRLRGKWLAAAGFPEGRRVRVVVLEGTLVLVAEPRRRG